MHATHHPTGASPDTSFRRGPDDGSAGLPAVPPRRWRLTLTTAAVVLAAVLFWTGQDASADPLVLTPDRGVRLAMERNERLLMARADLDRAGAGVREARADGLPQIDAQVNYDRNWLLPTFVLDGTTIEIGNDNVMSGGLTLTQPLYRGGRIRARLQASQLQVDRAREVERSVRQQIALEVETAFCDFVLASELARVSDLAVELARVNLIQVCALRQVGRASEYDLVRAEVRVATVRSDSIGARNDLNLAELRLKDVIALDLDQEIEVVAGFREHTKLQTQDLGALLEMGLDRRPNLRQLERLLALQDRELRAEKGAGRPRVDLVADGQVQYQEDDLDIGKRDLWKRSWSTGLRVQIPLFDGMRTRARTAQVREGARRLQYEKEKTQRSIEMEIRQSLMDLEEARQRLAARRGTVDQATKGLQVAESRYGSGVGTQLEVLDGQLSLVEAQTAVATAQRDRALAIIGLERSVGVLGEAGPELSDRVD
jgi:outer membrane protein TolC